MLNRVILIGRLAQEPELRYTPNGTAVCNFTIAVNRKFNREEADFINVVAWRGLAENCASYLGKGRLAAVEGRLQVRSYETQEGQKRRVTEVVADDVRFLDRAGTSSRTDANLSDNSPQDKWDDLGQEVNLEDIDLVDSSADDEIPF